mgnify:CR=1 FL=1
MKITFIVPSSQWLTAAGVRIRYKRLEPSFNNKGCHISIIPLQDITERCIQESDIVIISKVFSTDSLYLISLCRTLGIKVGLDLFDDYFSDQRLSVFRKFHPGGNLAKKLLCAEDLMVSPPFIYENYKMKKTLKILSQKKLGLLVVRNKKKFTSGLVVDGDLKRASQKYKNLHDLKVKDIMTKKPLTVDKHVLAVQCLNLMNKKRITSLLVHDNNKKNKTIGVLHIHKVLENVK